MQKHTQRWGKTEETIYRTLASFSNQELAGMSVSKFCKKAKLYRASFYIHYHSISAAAMSLHKKARTEFADQIKDMRESSPNFFFVLLTFIGNHKNWFYVAAKNHDYSLLYELFDIAKDTQLGLRRIDNKRQDFYINQLLAIVAVWIADEDCNKELIEKYARMLKEVRV